VTEPVPCGHWDILEGEHLPRVAELIAAELERLPQAPPAAPDTEGAASPAAGGAA
jgi:hypothetical protein